MPAKATVRVELVIDVPDNWGDDCSIGQIRKQAIDSASMALDKAFTAIKGIRVMSFEPTVLIIPKRS